MVLRVAYGACIVQICFALPILCSQRALCIATPAVRKQGWRKDIYFDRKSWYDRPFRMFSCATNVTLVALWSGGSGQIIKRILDGEIDIAM